MNVYWSYLSEPVQSVLQFSMTGKDQSRNPPNPPPPKKKKKIGGKNWTFEITKVGAWGLEE